ncbi:hypothetical protein HY970_01280 [Candidatus Kaiserbacteria bacterium]|nr:hypothetical protein [Candidatus Kaiserbacteria bacterium]
MSDGAMIEEVEGIEPLFHQVRVSADIGRMNARALIGIAGLWGNITVRCDARNALMFPSFFVVATCSEGVLSAGIGRDTCPLECAEALSKAFSKIGLPLIETCQTSEDTAILGSHAVGAWTTMRFDCFDPVLIALH